MGESKKPARWIVYLKQLWKGERFPSMEGKFTVICYALAIVHMLLFPMFFALDVPLMAILTLFSTGFYAFSCQRMIKEKAFFKAFVLTYSEVTLFACLATLTIGWNWGFMMYVIAISPVSYFITYSLPQRKRTMTLPVIFSLLAMIIFIVVKNISDIYPTFVTVVARKSFVSFVYLCNCLVTFTSIIIFSMLFSLEISSKEKELEAQNSKLSDISSIDPLTGLLNRRSMSTHLEKAVAEVKSTGKLFSMAIGDIDNFKMVNDIHGHNVGDDVLVMVSRVIKETLPENATFCRWGGEEFLILLPLVEADAVPVIESVRYAITQVTTKVDKPEGYIDLGVTMTFGVSQYIHGFSIDKIISIADENLYKGKENGKNRVVHSKTII